MRNPASIAAETGEHISSFILRCLPSQLDEVMAGLDAMAGVELHGSDGQGKCILLLEMPREAQLVSTISEIEQLPAPSGRLSSTLFVTALAHGIIILGITFSGTIDDSLSDSPTIRVSLVTGPADEPVDDAEYLGNLDQAGSGDTPDSMRPTARLRPRKPSCHSRRSASALTRTPARWSR